MAIPLERVGWIKLHRKYLGNPIWKHDAANRVFLWLLMAAERTAKAKRLGKREVALSRGQLATSQREIGAETGLTRKRVRIALKFLVRENAVVLDRPHGGRFTLVTVVNYGVYQGEEKEGGAFPSGGAKKGPKNRPRTGPGKWPDQGQGESQGNLFHGKELEGVEGTGGARPEAGDGPETGPESGPAIYKEEEVKEILLPPNPPQAGGRAPRSSTATTRILDMWREERERAGLAYFEDRRTLRGAKLVAEKWLDPGIATPAQIREAMQAIVRDIAANPKARLFDLCTLANGLSKYLVAAKREPDRMAMWFWKCDRCGETAAGHRPADAGEPSPIPCIRIKQGCDGVMRPKREGQD
ncbi:MAG: hypothetical protein LBT97_01925 [Planctomycetota bacterium]|jgi:hypothetical protein|nr:hypothetical protein [Planctomycetota bacterium]